MDKQVLHQNIYYYENVIKHFDEVMLTISELQDLHKADGSDFWKIWKSSNDADHVYGETKPFDLKEIANMKEPYQSKMAFIYHNITDALYATSKDYAESIGDSDEPKLFPVFNIKKYDTGSHMGAHFDQLDGDKTLRYSLVMYLNDDYEGGEISFKISDYVNTYSETAPHRDYDISVATNKVDVGIKPKANSVVIFPSSAPYYHTAHLVKSGFKYMVPGHWIHNNMDMNQGKVPDMGTM
jgi:hypothetical protein